MKIKQCKKCNASFYDGVLYWATGKEGKLEDLAGLVCDKYGNEECINELKGTKHNGDTWERRAGVIEGLDIATKQLMQKKE